MGTIIIMFPYVVRLCLSVIVWASCLQNLIQCQKIVSQCDSDFHQVSMNNIISRILEESLVSNVNETLKKPEEERSIRYPWINSSDEKCRNLSVEFATQGGLRMKALVSFPGSGNTWLRSVINE